ncbi:glycerol kinase GlpK [Shimia thalassica]|uniref:glycerol kinase GlpK n=1 Tax=Shimia thalassica TaxID=1715693 RepID=UPI002732F89D|nr:glycerol kinase GlpK [Shimia thalassica]MDP2579391.1 glycerol kinase GlpK [Shimia thalassica]
MTYILAIDQGTTSSRAILFDKDMQVASVAQQEFPQHFPASGWVEHDPDDLWSTTLKTCREALTTAGVTAQDVAAIGITNQRETTLVWDRHTGEPVHNAIVWQDRRTSEFCQNLKALGHEADVSARTGLLLDPYFSGTKLRWILDNVEGARERAEAGDLLFGTVDCFLMWKLTGGKVHATDATNASRTLLYDTHRGQWSPEMCALLDVPIKMLPQVRDCAAEFGTVTQDMLGAEIPILGVAGDQQAATIGQACFTPGMMKSTYGTGCFALLNTGGTAVASSNRLLTTVAYQLDGKTTYALEGAIFVAGAVVQWLRDGLGIIEHARDTMGLALEADPEQELILVPAFTGLGAPYWSPDSRGAVFGLSRNSGPAELARAALESVGFQTRDLVEAMQADMGRMGETVLRVDGGMTASDWTMQFVSDILAAPVDRPKVLESTATGAAWLAGMKAGLYPDMDGFAATWSQEKRFEPSMPDDIRERRYAAWKRAVAATLTV